MSINIRILNKLPDLDVETFARERTESMLSRFDARVSTVDMRVKDLNGGKGGEDILASRLLGAARARHRRRRDVPGRGHLRLHLRRRPRLSEHEQHRPV